MLRSCDAGINNWFGRSQLTNDLDNAALRTLRGHAIRADIEHPGGGRARAEVILHALNARCASIVYPGMIHRDSLIVLYLPLFEGGVHESKGYSLDCHHLTGNLHAVLLTFETVVNLTEFFPPGTPLPVLPEPAAKLPTKQFHGNCLILGSDSLDSRMVAYLSQQLGLTSKTATDVGSMFDMVTGHEFDLVLADAEAIAQAGGVEGLASQLYRIGLRAGLIVLNPSGTTNSVTNAVGELQIRHVTRPVTKDSLFDIVEDILKGFEPATSEVITSTLNDPAATELIDEYVSQLASDLETVLCARHNDDLGVAREMAVRWRETGTTFGFVPLSAAAKSVVQAMDASMSLEESAPELRRAISVVRRIVASMGPTTETRVA